MRNRRFDCVGGHKAECHVSSDECQVSRSVVRPARWTFHCKLAVDRKTVHRVGCQRFDVPGRRVDLGVSFFIISAPPRLEVGMISLETKICKDYVYLKNSDWFLFCRLSVGVARV